MRKNKNRNIFFINVISVFFVQILIKIVGMFYNIFLTNNQQYSDIGNGIFMSAHQIYILFLSVSIVGIPTSIAKLVSEKSKSGVDVEKVINISLMFWGIIGVIETCILGSVSEYIANVIFKVEEIDEILKLLSVGIVFVNFNSVYRGALNGIEKTSEGTIIQFIEQLIKVIFTILGINILRNINLENKENILYVVSLGVTISVIITSFIYMKKWRKYKNSIIENSSIRYIEIIKNILAISIPITIIGVFGSINKNIDSISIMKILGPIIGVKTASEKYGMIVSKVDVLINLPIGLNSAITIPLLPRLSKLYKENKIDEVRNNLILSLYMSFIIAIPSMIGLNVFASDVLNLLYPNASDGTELLKIGSILILLNVIIQIIMVYYNAIGNLKEVIKIFTIGSISKLILNISMIGIEGIYEKGIIFSSIISDVLIIFFLINNKCFKKLEIRLSDLKIFNILLETFIMIIISLCIIFVFKVNNLYNKFVFIVSLRNRWICLYFKNFYEKNKSF